MQYSTSPCHVSCQCVQSCLDHDHRSNQIENTRQYTYKVIVGKFEQTLLLHAHEGSKFFQAVDTNVKH